MLRIQTEVICASLPTIIVVLQRANKEVWTDNTYRSEETIVLPTAADILVGILDESGIKCPLEYLATNPLVSSYFITMIVKITNFPSCL